MSTTGDGGPQRALVTGAARRVGRAIALALGAEGAHVAVHYRSSRAEAEATCDAVESSGGRAFPIRADLNDRSAARKLVDDAVAELGGLDLLVPSAASFEAVEYDAIDDDAWDRSLRLNAASPFTLAHRATPALRAAKGSIVFITCSTTLTPMRGYLPYVVSKAALLQAARALALELAPDVRVNAVAPGTVTPPEAMSGPTLERIRGRIPLGRFGTAGDVADAVLALAKNRFVTGHQLVVDGGRTVAGFERFG